MGVLAAPTMTTSSFPAEETLVVDRPRDRIPEANRGAEETRREPDRDIIVANKVGNPKYTDKYVAFLAWNLLSSADKNKIK